MAEPAVRRSRRRRGAVGVLLILLALAAVVAVVLAGGASPRQISAMGVPVGDTTTIVTRRTLSESATVSGTLGYGGERELYDSLAGTFTWLPAVGAHIVRGGTLFRIDNLPVVLMYGTVPAYRKLEEGVSEGPDMAELNANLIDLGFDPYGAITDEATYGEATAAAVRRWQKAEGLPETGEVELGRVIFAPGAQRVTALHVALGQDPPGARSPTKPTGGESPSKPTGAKDKPSHGKSPTKSPSQSDAKPPSSKEAAKSPGSGEQASGGGEAVLSSTSTQQIVKLAVKPEQQQLAHLGEHVQVLLPGGGTAPGRISSVGTVASSPTSNPSEQGGGSDETTIPVTVTLERPVAHLDEAPVSVELLKSIRRDVLTVPATALIATAGGGYAVEVLEDDHRRVVPVIPGMFAGGYVQVEGSRVREGLTVVESE